MTKLKYKIQISKHALIPINVFENNNKSNIFKKEWKINDIGFNCSELQIKFTIALLNERSISGIKIQVDTDRVINRYWSFVK